ncbi:hypothetical protein Q4543_02595 [Salipiger sp. 1_MG-2023]|uniref:hypothetical protein n=1 Tax=Salipiger sp. 1_MG-2023 TaxID=3062665 RepID=UPI0026E31939|nr:hypothetical protein [Salipiger sp. 1_MG-2023]MDO6584396.1 hypothetical protein [Salipiger sp. 1_MG-2023]
MRALIALLLALPVMGCADMVPRKAGQLQVLTPKPLGFTEQVAANAAGPILTRMAPGVPSDKALACLFEHAQPGQIQALARNSALGQPELNDDIVLDILYDEDIRFCLRGGPIYWLFG